MEMPETYYRITMILEKCERVTPGIVHAEALKKVTLRMGKTEQPIRNQFNSLVITKIKKGLQE